MFVRLIIHLKEKLESQMGQKVKMNQPPRQGRKKMKWVNHIAFLEGVEKTVYTLDKLKALGKLGKAKYFSSIFIFAF